MKNGRVKNMTNGKERKLELDKWRILRGWLREGLDEALNKEEFNGIARTFEAVIAFMNDLDKVLGDSSEESARISE